MRIAFHQNAILERARLHLVGISNEIFRMGRIFPHRNEAPLHAGRESRTSAASKIRLLDKFSDVARGDRQCTTKSLVSTGVYIFREEGRAAIRLEVLCERLLHHVLKNTGSTRRRRVGA